MQKLRRTTEAGILEKYRIALDNATIQKIISSSLKEHGYDEKKILEGKLLFTETNRIWEECRGAKYERNSKHKLFMKNRDELYKNFVLHRKKVKILFRNEVRLISSLGVDHSIPRSYINMMYEADKFYKRILNSTEILKVLEKLNFKKEHVKAALELHRKVQDSRAEYIQAFGEAQNSTDQKNQALSKMKLWMSDFYIIARIGLEDNPQLLESLGIRVKGKGD